MTAPTKNVPREPTLWVVFIGDMPDFPCTYREGAMEHAADIAAMENIGERDLLGPVTVREFYDAAPDDQTHDSDAALCANLHKSCGRFCWSDREKAAARLAELSAENARIEREHRRIYEAEAEQITRPLREERDRLRAELEAARKDAERYRGLRASMMAMGPDERQPLLIPPDATAEQVDAVLDAALAQEKP